MTKPTLLVLRGLGLGDFLASVPALRALREAFPAHHTVLAAPCALEPLAKASGAVDELVDVAPLERLPERLHGADMGVNLHGKGPESHHVLLAARPRGFLAFRHPGVPESAELPEWMADEHEVDRWCRLVRETGIDANPAALLLDAPAFRSSREAGDVTVIHPGAASGARRWPPERFAAIVRSERRAGRRVLVTGSADERDLGLRIAESAGLPEDAVLAGKTDLLDLMAVVSEAGRLVSGDTGVAHLATALRTPSVTIFGPTSPALWGPRLAGHRHAALWAGEHGDPHASDPSAGLLAIQVEDVLQALEHVDMTHEAKGAFLG